MPSKHWRLGFVANSRLGFDGSDYRYQTGEWHYIERLAALFDEVDICAIVIDLAQTDAEDRARYVHVLGLPNAVVHNLSVRSGHSALAPGWLGRQLGAYAKLRHLCKSWDFALIMAPGWPALMSWVRSHVDHWPYAVCFRGEWVEVAKHRFPRNRWLRWLLPLYLHLIQRIESRILYDAAIRMTEGFALADRYPTLANSILSTVTLELPLEQFRRRSDTCMQMPARLIYVGSLVRRKGVDVTMRALAQLVAQGFDLEFHIVGDGPEQARLEQLCTRLGLGERIKFHGYVPNSPAVLDLYYRSDVFVLHSYSEGFPRVIYEAMSQSLPVIAARVGGIPIILEDEETALLVEPGDEQSLARGIARILTDTPLRQRLIRQGYELAYQIISSDPVEQAVELFQQRLSELIQLPSQR